MEGSISPCPLLRFITPQNALYNATSISGFDFGHFTSATSPRFFNAFRITIRCSPYAVPTNRNSFVLSENSVVLRHFSKANGNAAIFMVGKSVNCNCLYSSEFMPLSNPTRCVAHVTALANLSRNSGLALFANTNSLANSILFPRRDLNADRFSAESKSQLSWVVPPKKTHLASLAPHAAITSETLL